MLVLSRKQGEEIVIGADVRVKVVEVTGNRVKLALVAPREVPIQRAELRPMDAMETADEHLLVLVG